MGEIWLITGGARSGKSSFAEILASKWNTSIVMLATAEPIDEDMIERIHRHKLSRPQTWTTVEEPINLADAILKLKGNTDIVVDCLTVWVGNLFYRDFSVVDIEQSAKRVLEILKARTGRAVIVTNEVGMGIHPESEIGRRYRDCLGRVNATIARESDFAIFMSAGRGFRLETLNNLL